MFIKHLFGSQRENVALHATLETKEVKLIDDKTRGLVQFDNVKASTAAVMKFRGSTTDGINVIVDIELIGDPSLLEKFHFETGKIVGLVLRAID